MFIVRSARLDKDDNIHLISFSVFHEETATAIMESTTRELVFADVRDLIHEHISDAREIVDSHVCGQLSEVLTKER